VQGQFYRAANRFTCDNCAAQIQRAVGQNSVGPAKVLAAGVAGLATALAGGAVWAVTVHVTHWNIGYLAFFIGYAVGKVVHQVTGKGRGATLQWLGAILAGIGVEAGKVGLIVWGIVDALRGNGDPVTVGNVMQMIRLNVEAFKQPFDLIWIAFAAYAAWRMCKPANISIAGPYQYKSAGASGGGLQFDIVEPMQPPGNP
jgi:hypothetical protein